MLTAANEQRCEFCQDFLYFEQQYPTFDCFRLLMMPIHLDRSMNKQNPLKIHRVVETPFHPAKCTMWCAISKQGLTGLILVEHPITSQLYLKQLQNEVILLIQGGRHVDTTFFQQNAACPHTMNIILDVPHAVFGSYVLSN
jgi:hypothetical protein